MNTRLKAAANLIGDFFKQNKKSVICYTLVFVLGIIVGIIAAVNSNGGEFERVNSDDVNYGAVKVFFFSSLILAGGYFVIAVCVVSRKFGFVSVIVFFILGLYFGRYMCVLVGCYGGAGIVNLVFIYTPFFLVSFVCALLAACTAAAKADYCECEKGAILRPSIATVLKFFGVNVAVDFVIFVIIGSITKVIVVSL